MYVFSALLLFILCEVLSPVLMQISRCDWTTGDDCYDIALPGDTMLTKQFVQNCVKSQDPKWTLWCHLILELNPQISSSSTGRDLAEEYTEKDILNIYYGVYKSQCLKQGNSQWDEWCLHFYTFFNELLSLNENHQWLNNFPFEHRSYLWSLDPASQEDLYESPTIQDDFILDSYQISPTREITISSKELSL